VGNGKRSRGSTLRRIAQKKSRANLNKSAPLPVRCEKIEKWAATGPQIWWKKGKLRGRDIVARKMLAAQPQKKASDLPQTSGFHFQENGVEDLRIGREEKARIQL